MSPETAVTYTRGHFNQVFFEVIYIQNVQQVLELPA